MIDSEKGITDEGERERSDGVAGDEAMHVLSRSAPFMSAVRHRDEPNPSRHWLIRAEGRAWRVSGMVTKDTRGQCRARLVAVP